VKRQASLPEVENNTIVRTTTVNQLLIYVVSDEVDAAIIWEDMASWGEASGKLRDYPDSRRTEYK